ncbi:hypothetical protein GCM10010350_30100 [Streptomyces galilaeus]|nr:hypothetical protein GCM10010350_30100 [Streptomyces galilaeus]
MAQAAETARTVILTVATVTDVEVTEKVHADLARSASRCPLLVGRMGPWQSRPFDTTPIRWPPGPRRASTMSAVSVAWIDRSAIKDLSTVGNLIPSACTASSPGQRRWP